MNEQRGSAVSVRGVSASDTDSVRALYEQLGYPIPQQVIGERLGMISDSGVSEMLAAIGEDGAIVGLVHVGMMISIENGRAGQILAMVVDTKSRGSGIGGALLGHAEQWARSRGAAAMVLNSRVEREAARAFYGSHGYVVQKQQFRFRKDLTV